MKVSNVHFRELHADAAAAGALIDTLASNNDLLWPTESWPAMEFDRPLAVHADGGHGPIRYTVDFHDPGRSIVFRFKAPSSFAGTHRFDVIAKYQGCELRHTLEMDTDWPATLTWPLVFRRMHDALVEDCLAKAQAMLGEEPTVVPWPASVRLMRRLFGKGRARPQVLAYKRPAGEASVLQDMACAQASRCIGICLRQP